MESLHLLILLLVVAVSFVILAVQAFRLWLRKRLSRTGWIVAGIALLPIAGLIAMEVKNGGMEYNPSGATLERIAGLYVNGNASLILRKDGTYSSSNLDGLTSGTWSHFDWNLTLSGSNLKQPRWITRRGSPAVLPYYSGPDGSDGLLLRKQSEQAGAPNAP
ncbi:MAG: hypothetical protein EOP83_00495 [Verrucomicrobiaceae bacterium]|nr:MAG: hypothetical protein EOP83_00495 [Verrucomicrobiaceae bacterium]